MELGELKLTAVSDGEFRLDGGAMFGVVPRTLWEKPAPPDDRNRIRMGTNCLLVERGSDLLLIDTGIGDKHDPRFQGIYGMDPGAVRLPESIRRAGYEPGDVTHVLLSHLHFDHCGWNTRRDEAGRLVPTFPKARYWLQRGEVEHGRGPNERDRASYFPENWEPLIEAGVAELFGEEGYSTRERTWGRPTCDVNGIFGGYMGKGAKTVLPSWGGAKVSMRLVPDQDSKKIAELFTAHVQSIAPAGVTVEVTPLHGGDAVVVEVKGPIVDAALDAMEEIWGARPVRIREGGSIPIVSTFAAVLKCPVLLLGFGLNDDGLHSPNEKFNISHFYKGIRSVARLLDRLGDL